MKLMFPITCLIFLTACYSKEPEKTGHEGQVIPSVQILLADSTTYLDTKNIQTGKPFAIFLFGPYCPYSKEQMRVILENKERLKNMNFYVLTRWPFKDMIKFYNEFELNKYDNIITGRDSKGSFRNYFETQGVPYLAIYGKDKKLKKAFIGKTFAKIIEEVANE